MNFYEVIGLFEDAGVKPRQIYWTGRADYGPDLLIQTEAGLRHVAAVKVNEAGDIIVELEDAANRLGEALG